MSRRRKASKGVIEQAADVIKHTAAGRAWIAQHAEEVKEMAQDMGSGDESWDDELYGRILDAAIDAVGGCLIQGYDDLLVATRALINEYGVEKTREYFWHHQDWALNQVTFIQRLFNEGAFSEEP